MTAHHSKHRGGRPQLDVDELAVLWAYDVGVPINYLASTHGVDRYVIRRVLDAYGAKPHESRRLRNPRGAT